MSRFAILVTNAGIINSPSFRSTFGPRRCSEFFEISNFFPDISLPLQLFALSSNCDIYSHICKYPEPRKCEYTWLHDSCSQSQRSRQLGRSLNSQCVQHCRRSSSSPCCSHLSLG